MDSRSTQTDPAGDGHIDYDSAALASVIADVEYVRHILTIAEVRRFLIDSGVRPAGKRDAMRRILAGKVHPAVVMMVTKLFWAGGTRAFDGTRLTLDAAGYARAFVEIAGRTCGCGQFSADLVTVQGILSMAPVQAFLADASVTDHGKMDALIRMFRGRMASVVVFVAVFIFRMGELAKLAAASDALAELAVASRDYLSGEILAAYPLDAGRVGEIERAAGVRLGRTLRLTARVSPEVMAGIRVRTGSRIIDCSVDNDLENMRRTLAGAVTAG